MNRQWKVIYYVSGSGEIPVREFLNKVEPRVKAKALRILFTIKEYGLQHEIPHLKKLAGTPL